MSQKYVCIHGHFYQPPRENAWLEDIELQDSAYPFHDWNERINYECYAPNAASRILGEYGKITKIVNNYLRISYNFGPTLLSWLEKHAPETYADILKADRESIVKYGGHGNAMAQVYNHIIMPLANLRDKITQVKWGIYDFEYRYRRKPEGMWLAETAVDTETLEVLADHGIKYTVLAPRQGAQVRKIGEKNWTPVNEGSLDTTRPYQVNLPSGKTIAVFYYHGGLAQEVAFNGLLKDGKRFAHRIIDSFAPTDDPQLIHIATDGESYGHHHKLGDMALSFCLDYIEQNKLATITNYGQYLELFPPEYETQIHENSSWSCVHGVERWRSNCGCSTGGHPDWNQEWRSVLRNALDWLRDRLNQVYLKQLKEYQTPDPWSLRNSYIQVIYNRDSKHVHQFLESHGGRKLTAREKTRLLRLLEMQRQALLMYTSCGWFFDEISGIETTQILQYANRAMQLAEQEGNVHLEEEFINLLAQAHSNISEYGTGANIYEQFVEPRRLTLSKVGMHYAVASIFSNEPDEEIFIYRAENEYFDRLEAGVLQLIVGRTKVHSRITLSKKRYSYAALYLGQQHIIGSVSDAMTEATFDEMYVAIKQAFYDNSVAAIIAVMEQYFGSRKFSLRSLFKDEQRHVLEKILSQDLELAADSYKKIYNRNYNLLSVLNKEKVPLPFLLQQNLKVVINNDLMRYLEDKQRSVIRLQALVKEVEKWNIELDRTSLQYVAADHLHFFMQIMELKPQDYELLRLVLRKLTLFNRLSLEINLYKVQNSYYKIISRFDEILEKLGDDRDAKLRLTQTYKQLGDLINMAFHYELETAN